MRKDPLGEKLFLDKFYEVTEVIRTVHVQAGDSHYRIEINKHYTNPKTPFTASYFVKHQVPNPEAKIEGETLDSYLLDTSLPSGSSPFRKVQQGRTSGQPRRWQYQRLQQVIDPA
jgi:hypothetical protein